MKIEYSLEQGYLAIVEILMIGMSEVPFFSLGYDRLKQTEGCREFTKMNMTVILKFKYFEGLLCPNA